MKDLHIYAPEVTIELINYKKYNVVKFVSFQATESTTVGNELRAMPLRSLETGFIWDESFIKGVIGLDAVVASLFGTKEIGLIYAVNGSEPKLSVEDAKLKNDDYVLVAYIEKNWR